MVYKTVKCAAIDIEVNLDEPSNTLTLTSIMNYAMTLFASCSHRHSIFVEKQTIT